MQRVTTSAPPVSTPKASPTQTASPSRTPRPTPSLEAVRAGGVSLREGDRSQDVAVVQRRLNAAGADPALAADGAFGPNTRAAVETFQRERGLVVDGLVGPRTIAALDAAAAARPADGIDAGGAGAQRRGAAPSVSPGGAPTPASTTRPARGLQRAAPLPAGLAPDARTRVSAALAGQNGQPAQRALQDLMASPAYRGLPEPSRAQLLTTTMAPAPGGLLGGLAGGGPTGSANRTGAVIAARTSQAAQLLQSPAMTRLGAADRARVVDVYAGSPQSTPTLLRLAGVGGADRLSAPDFRGGTMLDSLHGLATGPLARGVDRQGVLSSTMAEVENPARIEQWGQGTCAATSVTLRLARQSPAEYARIVAGLAGPSGAVTLRDGETANRNGGSLADNRSGRSTSERLIQDSFMGFANGNLNYNVASDTSTGEGGGGGLNLAEVSRLQSSVFGERYRTVTTVGRQVTRDAGTGERLWRNFRNNLDRATFRHDPNSPMAMVRQELGRGRSAIIGMQWGEERHSAHAVVVERIEGGRVFFQNPHSNAYHGQAVGAQLSPPPRRVERDNIQSMTVADFQTRLSAVSTRE
jgi:peptidoglycan hydrolase-like protein with peptidoglycan-binding domain